MWGCVGGRNKKRGVNEITQSSHLLTAYGIPNNDLHKDTVKQDKAVS